MTRSTKLVLLIISLVALGWLIVFSWLRHSLPPNAVTLTLSQTSYTPDQDIIVTITNNTDRELIAENQCPREPLLVEYQADNTQESNQWEERTATKSEGDCPKETNITLAPRQTKTINYRPWQTELFRQTGRYRLELELEQYETRYHVDFNYVAP